MRLKNIVDVHFTCFSFKLCLRSNISEWGRGDTFSQFNSSKIITGKEDIFVNFISYSPDNVSLEDRGFWLSYDGKNICRKNFKI